MEVLIRQLKLREWGMLLMRTLELISVIGTIQQSGAQNIEYDMINATAVLSGSPYFMCVSDRLLTGSQKMQFYSVIGGNEDLLASLNNDGDIQLPNPGKYNITSMGATFYFYVKGVTTADEGMYRCKLERGGGGADTKDAYLIVSDPPAEAELYWTGRVERPERGTRVELTCSASRSRPPASFRWLRDDGMGNKIDYSYHARNPIPTVDMQGYGVASSVQEMVISDMDDGTSYKCFVDVPGGEGWYTLERSVDGGIMTSPNLLLLTCVMLGTVILSFR